MSKFCSSCGNPMEEGQKFCVECGAQVIENSNSFMDKITIQDEQAIGEPNTLLSSSLYIKDWGIKQMFFRHDNRLNRKRYLIRVAVLSIIGVFVNTIMGNFFNNVARGIVSFEYLIINIVIALVVVGVLTYSSCCTAVRRLHDLGKSGSMCIGLFVPVVNLILGLYLLFAPGVQGANEYGPDPLLQD